MQRACSIPSQPPQLRPTRLVRTAVRRGFTLLEVLIALALMVLLLSVVYGVMDSYFQLSEYGRMEAKRAQIARAVFDRISVDIRSVVFEPVEEEMEEGEEAEGLTTVEPDLSLVSTDEAFTAGIVGLAGTSTELVMHIARPTRDAAIEAIVDGIEPDAAVNELQLVNYFVAAQTASVLGEMVIRDAGQDSFSLVPESDGLSRVWGDAVTIRSADEGADPESLVQSFKLLAPEIIHLKFSYLDAGEETDTWDSRALNRLPQAIRIEIGFRSEQLLSDDDSDIDLTSPVKYYSKVVALPLSEPYVDELAF